MKNGFLLSFFFFPIFRKENIVYILFFLWPCTINQNSASLSLIFKYKEIGFGPLAHGDDSVLHNCIAVFDCIAVFKKVRTKPFLPKDACDRSVIYLEAPRTCHRKLKYPMCQLHYHNLATTLLLNQHTTNTKAFAPLQISTYKTHTCKLQLVLS
ncbi:hypothetical protein RIF29_32228 [Crotalaria pallida]|uniref:Uncharacterized protein n=1 Tax=Crotalaria pallida TaxID=3830 RepID=A0AAN9EIJ3_CROPI